MNTVIDHRPSVTCETPRAYPPPWRRRERAPGAARGALLAVLLVVSGAARAAELTLDEEEAVRRATASSHTLEAVRQRVASAAHGVAAANSGRWPVLTAQATTAYRSSVPEFAAPLAGPGQPSVILFPDLRTTAAASLVLTQPLYTGGTLSARGAAARRDLEVSEAALATALLDLRLAARTAYWRAAATQADVAVAEQHVRRSVRFAEDVAALRAAGLAVEADVLAAQARSAAARLALLRSRRAADEAVATLRSLLDLPADATVRLADAATATLPPPPGELEALQATASRQRPELTAARARTAAFAARAAATRAAARPAVTASAEWELARPNPRLLPLQNVWHDSWAVGLASRWTLWDGGRTAAEAAALEAEVRASQAELADLERRIALEVEQALLALHAELAAAAAAAASHAASRARLAAVTARHAAGLALTAEVLDAQAELAAAEGDGVVVATSARLAAALLARAVGQ